MFLPHNIKRIVIIGPESTGKSTLTQALAQHYNTVSVPEYARAYLEQLPIPYTEPDLLAIAAGQVKTEEEGLQTASQPLIFCDTDLHVIKVWSEDKYNRCHHSILQTIAERRYDLYLLTDIDMPWQEDPLREHPEPTARAYFFHIYHDIVQQTGVPFVRVNGHPEQRLHTAIKGVEGLLSQK